MNHSGLYMLVMELTEDCNLRCGHCYGAFGRGATMELDQTVRILDQAQALGVKWVTLTGGEPLLLGDQIFAIAEEVRARGMNPTLETNGLLVTTHPPERYRLFYSVQISVEGGRTYNDTVRGKGTFDKAMEAFDYLLSAGVKTGIQAVATAESLRELPYLVDVVKAKGGYLAVERYVRRGRGVGQLPLSSSELFRCIRFAMEANVVCNDPLGQVLQRRFDDLYPAGRLRGGCLAGVAALCVTADLSVLPCPKLRVPAGSILRQTLEELWEDSKFLGRLRDRSSFGQPCGSCEFNEICGGCRAAAMAEFGDPTAADPQCFYRWVG